MNHKAVATCPNGHKFEFGTCKADVPKLFGGTKVCSSKGFKELSDTEVQCLGCKSVHDSRLCPECGARVPIAAFRKESFFAKLG